MILRPRQSELVKRSLEALRKNNNTLAVAPTGAGKSVMMSAVTNQYINDGGKACILAHRDELTTQNRDKYLRVNEGAYTSIYNSNVKEWRGDITFAMVQTLCRESNLSSMPRLDLLVIDEAHHAPADSYKRIIDKGFSLNPNMRLFGVTATPNRGDKKSLRKIFSNVADQITVKELIISGHLVLPKTYVMNIGVTDALSKVKKTALDYDMGEVANIMNKRPINDAVVKHWKAKAHDRQTVVFCSTIDHAKAVTISFKEAGISIVMIWGDMADKDRVKALSDYDKGLYQVIVNVAVLTEGWDHPPTSCVVLLRPSSHKSTMVQMVGRGLRTVNPDEYPNIIKKDCVILDFGTATLTHGSLEQDASLSLNEDSRNAPHKDCPDCGASIPNATRECPLCGFIWESEAEPEAIEATDFIMREIDILKKSNFQFCDVRGDEKVFVATGFDAWAGVFATPSSWVAVGGKKGGAAKHLSSGERMQCLASADDWMNMYETASGAHKTKTWLKQPATPKQVRFLPQQYKNDHNLTRYHASALMTLRFNKDGIRSILNNRRAA